MWTRLFLFLAVSALAYALNVPLTRKARHNAEIKKTTHKEPLDSFAGVAYYGVVTIGSPPQKFNMTFDTGIGDIWIPTKTCRGDCYEHKKYNHDKSKTYIAIEKPLNLNYPGGQVRGFISGDVFRLSDKLVVPNQVFVEARLAYGVYVGEDYDGVIGLAFPQTSMSGAIPLVQNMVSLGMVEPIFSLYLNKKNEGSELTLGGMNPELFQGKFAYANLTEGGYWQFELDFKIKKKSFCKDHTCQVKADTGDALISGAMCRDINEYLGAKSINAGLYSFDCKKVSKLPPISFVIAGVNLKMTHEYYVIEDIQDGECLSVFTYKKNLNVDLNLGLPFLQAFYSVYNIDSKKIGFAHAKH